MVVRPRCVLGCVLALGALACSERALRVQAPQPEPSGVQALGSARERDGAEGSSALPPPMTRADSFQRGVSIGPIVAPEDEATFKREHAALLDRALALGASDVELIVRWLQTDPTATEIAPADSVDDELLSWLIDQAKRRKLRVRLAPVLGVEAPADARERNEVEARGPARERSDVEDQGEGAVRALAPRDPAQWWWNFQRFTLHYARVSGMRKVSLLTLGSGLTQAEPEHERWRALITEIRKVYKGKLSYEASSESFERVAFWDALDVMGVVVDQPAGGSEAQRVATLTQLAERLARAAAAHGRGYLLSEGNCGATPTDAKGALLCQRALFQTFRDQPQLSGVYVHTSAATPASDVDAASAAEVVRHWYSKSRG